MSESYEFKLFDDKLKKKYLLSQIFDGEVNLFQILLAPLDPQHPDYEEWKYQLEENKKVLKQLMDVYEKLGGTYDLQEIRNVINNAQ